VMIVVSVSDDGIGIDVSKLEEVKKTQNSFGLFYLKERLRDIGGGMDIESEANKGTTVKLMAPKLNEREIS